MTGNGNNIQRQDGRAASPLTSSPSSGTTWSDAQRLAVSLADTGVLVATLENGRLSVVSTDEAPIAAFVSHYAISGFERLAASHPIASDISLNLSVPGVIACTLPPTAKRVPGHALSVGGPTAIVLLVRRSDFDAAAEDVQRLCGTLKLDRQWLANEAKRTASMTPELLERLTRLAWASVRNDARLSGLVVERDALSGQLAETYEELTLIYQISSGMRVNRSVDDFFLQACMDVIDVMNVRGAGYVVTDTAGKAQASALYGDVELDPTIDTCLTDELLRHFRNSPKPLLINDIGADPTFRALAGQIKRLVAVPIQRQDKILGALFCLDKNDRDFTTQDSKLLNSIGNETAIYLENSSLFTDARGLMMGLLHALTSAVDAKDAYTCGHSQRVALFGREIAKCAGLPDSLGERVYMAGLLHDVGKIGVPEDVLRKPGKLTNEEFDLMKRHVEIGAHILRDVRQIEDLLPGVLYHHERYDGKGYPHSLSGQGVPLIARILCVADCFDAMTSNRTYRKALPIEVALMEIRRCAGTQFDPLLADAFLSIGAPRLRELINSVTEQTTVRLAA